VGSTALAPRTVRTVSQRLQEEETAALAARHLTRSGRLLPHLGRLEELYRLAEEPDLVMRLH
jgi:hypothetical protein